MFPVGKFAMILIRTRAFLLEVPAELRFVSCHFNRVIILLVFLLLLLVPYGLRPAEQIWAELAELKGEAF